MTHILLVCLGGASTSLLALYMEKAARRFQIDVSVRSVSENMMADSVGDADVILLGPQMAFKRDQVGELVGDTPVGVIDMRSYGRMDGAAVLDQALELLQK